MATNKLLPFANGIGANVIDYASWAAKTTLLSGGFVTGIAKSEEVNRLLAQGALASYILGQLVVDQTAQDADLDEATFYTNFKNALTAYINGGFVSLTGAQTVGGVKTFTSSPVVPTADAADSSTKVANTAFVQGELTSQAVKLTGAQTVDGVKTFTSSPVIPTETAGDSSTKAASTAFVQTEIANQAVKFDSAQTLTATQKQQARANIGFADTETYTIEAGDTEYLPAAQIDQITCVRTGNVAHLRMNITPTSGKTYSDVTTVAVIKNFPAALDLPLVTTVDQGGLVWIIHLTKSVDLKDVNIRLFCTTTTTGKRLGAFFTLGVYN